MVIILWSKSIQTIPVSQSTVFNNHQNFKLQTDFMGIEFNYDTYQTGFNLFHIEQIIDSRPPIASTVSTQERKF